MKNINELDRLRELLVKHNMPKEQTLFMEIGEYNETMSFLKNFGSYGAISATLQGSNPELECVRMNYGGYTFNIISY